MYILCDHCVHTILTQQRPSPMRTAITAYGLALAASGVSAVKIAMREIPVNMTHLPPILVVNHPSGGWATVYPIAKALNMMPRNIRFQRNSPWNKRTYEKQASQTGISNSREVIAPHSILWDANTFPCLRYLLLVPTSSYLFYLLSFYIITTVVSHGGHVSFQWEHDCPFTTWFRLTAKKIWTFLITGRSDGESAGDW